MCPQILVAKLAMYRNREFCGILEDVATREKFLGLTLLHIWFTALEFTAMYWRDFLLYI